MSWYLFAFIAPALWSMSNHIDKHLLTRFFQDEPIGAIIIISGVSSAITAILVAIFYHQVFAILPWHALMMMVNGALFVAMYFAYFNALQLDEASNVVPIYQTVPIFGFILGYALLHETLTSQQVIAGALIILGAIGISLDTERGFKLKHRVLLLMLLSSFIAAITNVNFKFVTLQENYWITNFWELSGFAVTSLMIFVFSRYSRQKFIHLVTHAKATIFAISGFSEGITSIAGFMANYSFLFAPVALVSVVINGLQPFYVFIFGVLITLLWPSLGQEKLNREVIIQKCVAIALMFTGTILLH